MCTSCIQVATQRLKDHLPGGLNENPSEILLQETKSVRKHNLLEENDFGHLDYMCSQKQKTDASTKHHSSIIMTKINKTTNWLKNKSPEQQQKLHKIAR